MGWVVTAGEALASGKFCVAAVMYLFSMCCGDIVNVVCCAYIFLKISMNMVSVLFYDREGGHGGERRQSAKQPRRSTAHRKRRWQVPHQTTTGQQD